MLSLSILGVLLYISETAAETLRAGDAGSRLQEQAIHYNSLGRPLFVDQAVNAINSYRLDRDILQSRWDAEASHENLPCSGPKYKGFVQKTGSATNSPTLMIGMGIRKSELYANERLPIYGGCQVRSPPVCRPVCCNFISQLFWT